MENNKLKSLLKLTKKGKKKGSVAFSTTEDIYKLAKNIKDFRGVYMLDSLPPSPPQKNESGIFNLGGSESKGTHWVAYRKVGKNVIYFDSFGNLKPPKELANYLRNCNIIYNRDSLQNFQQWNCGILAVRFLKKYTKNRFPALFRE